MKLNLASGQRPFPKPWVNIDIRDQGYQIDIETNIKDLHMFEDNSVDVMVGHHVWEHIPLHEQESFVKEWWRVLKPGGRVLLCVPDMRAVARKWINGEIDAFTFAVNASGAWQGHITDIHRWQYDQQELVDRFSCWDGKDKKYPWINYRHGSEFDLNRNIYSGADIAFDWWILCMEFIKPQQ